LRASSISTTSSLPGSARSERTRLMATGRSNPDHNADTRGHSRPNLAEIIPLRAHADLAPGLSMPRVASTESKRSMPGPILASVENVAAPGPDPIADALGWALKVWSDERDARCLRRALLAVLAKLDEVP
jgi:hypothetical protein